MMSLSSQNKWVRWYGLILSLIVSILMIVAVVSLARISASHALAAPIPPPEGYPKFIKSTMTVNPALVHTGGAHLVYTIELRNTGAYTAEGTTLLDVLPYSTTYNGDAWASLPPAPEVISGMLSWNGTVGFDSSVIITFSVATAAGVSGTVQNQAVITQPLIAQPVTLTAHTVVTDDPRLSIEKDSTPVMPGANKPLVYLVKVTNHGQPAAGLPITVTDQVPLSTTFFQVGPDGFLNGNFVTWHREVDLGLEESTFFTFSVMIDDVPSGTVIANTNYQVEAHELGVNPGEPYTVTVVDPIFYLSKHVNPDPPGSNREMTYTLTILNKGSLATGLVITDRVPAHVSYVQGGNYANGVVSWLYPELDTYEVADFEFTVYISDIMNIPIVNRDYRVCSSEGVCTAGVPLTVVVGGPTFEAFAYLDPIAKKPGGGGGPVTPTLVVRNIGPGNALGALANLQFDRISVSGNDLYADPPIGTPPPFPPGPDCGGNCSSFLWMGDLSVGDAVSFTTYVGQSTIGGEEWTGYTATVYITDTLVNTNTIPISATMSGHITHFSNLVPTKYAPTVIGRGQLFTYLISIWNSGLSTTGYPWLTDTVPLSVSLVSISDGGTWYTVGERTVVSWTLPAMGPGDLFHRSFTVMVDQNLVSGTQIVNDDYAASFVKNGITFNWGPPVTTTVKEAGLIDSYKEVVPRTAPPGPSVVLTYYVHIVNSSAINLLGVKAYDFLPWEDSTYLRDAVASAGTVISDIVSLEWTGDVPAMSERVITLTVEVDAWFEGAITNTVVITHPDLVQPIVKHAVAYITDKPVLFISKTATPDPVRVGGELLYKISVLNLGPLATNLVISDTIPVNAIYVPDSVSSPGVYLNGQVIWQIPALQSEESRSFTFRVIANGLHEIVNSDYQVYCAEGIKAVGASLHTKLIGIFAFLPIISK